MNNFFKDEHYIFKDQIRKFCETEIVPLVEDAEKNQITPKHLFPQMGSLGFLCIRYPEDYGGIGSDKIMDVILREEMSRVCQGIASSWSAHSHLATFPIYHGGTEEQRNAYLIPAVKGQKIGAFALTEPNAGSDTKSIKSVAVKKGNDYILRGSKTFISNAPFADYLLTAAYTDPSKGYNGISLFIVDSNTKGVHIKKLDKQGIRSSETGEIFFDECKIERERLLGGREGNFQLIMNTLSEGRIGVAGNMVGVAQSAFEYAVKYAKQRVQFGKSISKFQSISNMLADMAAEIHAARLMVLYAAQLLDNGQKCTFEASSCKLVASETAVRVSRNAVQIHGGYGLMTEYPVFRCLRDSLVYTIGEGTSEIQRNIIAKELGL